MNKIFTGILGLMLVVGVTSGTAYALFSSKATASNVTFATGNADLRLYNGSDWVANWDPSLSFLNLYPGYLSNKPMYLKNISTSPIALTVVGKMKPGVTESPLGSWNILKDAVSVAVNLSDDSASTGWHTLNEWFTTGYTLPGGAIAQNTQKNYKFYVKIDASATDTISGKTISGIVFEFTGTQTP